MSVLTLRGQNRVQTLIGAAWMIFILIFSLFPVYWIVLASFKHPQDLIATTLKFLA